MARKLGYTDANMKEHSDREQIRYAPAGFVVTNDSYGQYHMIKEVIDNSIDEVAISSTAYLEVFFFQDTKRGTWQVIVNDTGRGIPLNSVYDAVNKLKFSGKFDRSAYQTSSGMYGYGLTVATALASRFRVVARRDNKVVSVDNLGTSPDDTMKQFSVDTNVTGTMVILECNPVYFTEVEPFVDQGYNFITTFLKTLSIFSNVTARYPDVPKYKFYLIPQALSKKCWTCDGKDIFDVVQSLYTEKTQPLFDSREASDSVSYLSELWEFNCPITWKEETTFTKPLQAVNGYLSKRKDPITGKYLPLGAIGYDIRLYLPKTMRTGKVLSMVNNVVIRRQSSTHIEVMKTALKKVLAPLIKDEQIRQYFIDLYDLPICMAMNIQYEGAQFSGVTKDGFIDQAFGECFASLISKQCNTMAEPQWLSLYSHLASHIENSYIVYYNKPVATKTKVDQNAIKTKYYDCSTTDRTTAELFIVEGTSADHIRLARDAKIHAVYLIKGVPSNPISTQDKVAQSRIVVDKYTAYKDLKRLLQVEPNQTSVSHCRFGKIIISTDADSDGYHIASSHVGAIYIINSLLIELGYVYIANPPLYEIVNGNENIPLRNRHDLIEFWLKSYTTFLNIYYDSSATKGKIELIPDDVAKGLFYTILEIGDILSERAIQLAVPPVILERLATVSYALDPNNPDLDTIRKVLNTNVWFNQAYQILTIEGPTEDTVISLNIFRQQLYADILPLLQQIAWRNIHYYVASKMTKSQSLQEVTIMQLYNILTNINNIFKVTRHKGLGGMSPESLFQAFINKQTRVLTRITSLGDVDTLYGMLGDEVTARKEMLADPYGTSSTDRDEDLTHRVSLANIRRQ